MTAAISKLATAPTLDASALVRIVHEGYGPGAWHGPDLKAALSDVTGRLAFKRPAPDRHNIAEIVLHHAYTIRTVREKLSGKPVEAFVLEGEDWFVLDGSKLTWREVVETLESQQRQLEKIVAGLDKPNRLRSDDVNPFDLVLGVTCHAIYHAGQIQLVKRLLQE